MSEVKVDGLPEGYKVVRYGVPEKGEWYLPYGWTLPKQAKIGHKTKAFVLAKTEPKRLTLELTDEIRYGKEGEFITCSDGCILEVGKGITGSKYPIWRVVEKNF